MRQLIRWRAGTRFRLKLAHGRGMLAGAALLTLTLGLSGLLLTALAASAGPARAEAGVSVPQPRSTRTPRPTPTPSPTPRATVTPSPTATVAAASPTAAVTRTANPGAGSGGSGDGAQAAGTSLGSLPWWGLGVLVLVFGGFIILFTSRMAREEQRPAFAPPAQRSGHGRLNQLHQFLPSRQAAPISAGDAAEPLPEEDPGWESLLPVEETYPPAPLKPPQWLIDAGFLRGETGELPAEDQQEP